MDAFHKWLRLHHSQPAPNSGLRKALDYILNRWPVFLYYLEAGRVPIDTNRCENAMRPVVVARGKLHVRRLAARRVKNDCYPEPAENRQTKRPRSLYLAAGLINAFAHLVNNTISELLPYAENSFT